jgi:DNA-binding beta-propeller fold protein YncE
MKTSPRVQATPIIVLCLFIFLSWHSAGAAPIKLRVIVDNANIKATPEIGSPTLANIPLDSLLEAEAKHGEWYKVTLTRDGTHIIGFIHDLLVKEVAEGESRPGLSPAGVVKSQAEIAAEIELRMEEDKNLIRQESDLDKAISSLRPLLAKTFSLDDRQKQKQIACEIYLWLGLGYAKRGDDFNAVTEFKNMFEVDYAFAKEITRNIYDPQVSGFIDHAEKQYRGLLVEYTLEIATEPKEAKVKVDGKEIGLSPEIYRTTMPRFVLEIDKEGFKPVKEEIFLTKAVDKKEYTLESIGRTIAINSEPKEAGVFLDGEDTGKLTDCELPYVPYGNHVIRVSKKSYANWEETVQVLTGPGPLSLSVNLTAKDYVFVRKLGGPESKFFKLPRAIAFDAEGNFYVLDDSDIKTKKFDSAGSYVSTWGDSGREFRILKDPAGMAVDNQGNIYITDAKSACVFKFSKAGKLVQKWGKEGTGQGELNAPSGIAVDSDGDIYVADSGNHRILKYSPQGNPQKTWGKQGAGQGEFMFPSVVAVDQKNDIIVLDRVQAQRFNGEGQFIAAWGKAGSGDGEMKAPMGLCSDAQNYIYVADTGNSRILKFDPQGKLITQWGAAGPGEGQVMGPFGIAINNKGSVFVVERDANRLQEYKVASQ